MKKKSILNSFLYILIRISNFLVKFVPIKISFYLAKFIGIGAYYFLYNAREGVYQNLIKSFPHYSSTKIETIIKDAFIDTIKHLVGILYVPEIDDNYIKKYLEFHGSEEVLMEYIQSLINAKKNYLR